MAGELVLITGSNGALGFPIVLHTLRAGYRVRAVVRSQSKADLILHAPSIQSLDGNTKTSLSFAIVPDLLQENAYTEALDGATFAIHVASPIPSGTITSPDDLEAAIVTPAIKGTMNMLEAAERTPSIRRVVITSSVVGQIPFSEFTGPLSGTGIIYTETSRVPDPTGPYENESAAYHASKVLALNAAERWMKEKKDRRFTVVHVHPGLIIGRTELATTLEAMLQGSNGRAVASLTGKEMTLAPVLSNTVWTEDVAEVHVRALDEECIADGQSLVVQWNNPKGVAWKDGKKIIEAKFPKAVEKGVLPNAGWPESKVLSFDVSETERLVGMKFEGFEKQLLDVAEQYLEFMGEEKA